MALNTLTDYSSLEGMNINQFYAKSYINVTRFIVNSIVQPNKTISQFLKDKYKIVEFTILWNWVITLIVLEPNNPYLHWNNILFYISAFHSFVFFINL